MTRDVRISETRPLDPDLGTLLAELNDAIREMEPGTPDEFNFCLTAEEMDRADTTVWIAKADGEAVGCCALLRHGDGLGEIKRMYVRPSARGLRIGLRMLEEVERRAGLDGVSRLALETGTDYAAARRLYESAGFERCGPFADYRDNPYSMFYAKTMEQASVPARVSGS